MGDSIRGVVRYPLQDALAKMPSFAKVMNANRALCSAHSLYQSPGTCLKIIEGVLANEREEVHWLVELPCRVTPQLWAGWHGLSV